MNARCEEVQDLLIDQAYGEQDPAGCALCRAHLLSCRSCRDAADRLDAVRSLLDRAAPSLCSPCTVNEAWYKVKAGLAARRRREVIVFAGVAAGLLAAFWAGLAAIDPRLPIYVQLGVVLNLSLFYLPIHLLRRREECTCG